MATKQTSIHTFGLEQQLLKDYTKTSTLVLLRFNSQAILLAAGGASSEIIALAVNRKPITIVQWLHDWRKRRLSSIFSGHQDNRNAGKLTDEQLAEIQQTLQSPPSDFGLPSAFWDMQQLKQYMTTNFDVVYESDRSYHYLLRFANLSFKYADTFDRKRDERFIVERMAVNRKKESQSYIGFLNQKTYACELFETD
jgi:transposase